MKSLPSEFEGVLYRSRMEARWAVFMRTCGVPFEYEVEGFNLGGGLKYLPDFYLPFQDSFMEVKSPVCDPADWNKIHRLSNESGKNIFVFTQNPHPPSLENWYKNESSATIIMPDAQDEHYIWCECPACGKCGITFDGPDRLPCKCKKDHSQWCNPDYSTVNLFIAYRASAGQRFDNL